MDRTTIDQIDAEIQQMLGEIRDDPGIFDMLAAARMLDRAGKASAETAGTWRTTAIVFLAVEVRAGLPKYRRLHATRKAELIRHLFGEMPADLSTAKRAAMTALMLLALGIPVSRDTVLRAVERR